MAVQEKQVLVRVTKTYMVDEELGIKRGDVYVAHVDDAGLYGYYVLNTSTLRNYYITKNQAEVITNDKEERNIRD